LCIQVGFSMKFAFTGKWNSYAMKYCYVNMKCALTQSIFLILTPRWLLRNQGLCSTTGWNIH
jgi:hypothetical protein